MTPPDDVQYELLRQLTREPAASQRSLAARMGVSVGKVNYCLRALVHKGLVKANNFRRSDNKLAYAYVLTPAGIEEKAELAHNFLQRKISEFEQIQREIHELTLETRSSPSIEPATSGLGDHASHLPVGPTDTASR
ncbi:MAG: MarR family EPS-associated transcriptional regulator [Burkholderiales bacterium]